MPALTPFRAFRATVTGLVQGVGFRYWTARRAAALGVAGWVANLPGGDVEVLAQGRPEDLEEFAAWLAEGPPHARVASVERRACDTDPSLTGFAIR